MTISRAQGSLTSPEARLTSCLSPPPRHRGACPCGYYGDLVKECTCSPSTVTRYQKRVSGPLLDRIDTLRDVEVPRVDYNKLTDARLGEPSEAVRARVEAARE